MQSDVDRLIYQWGVDRRNPDGPDVATWQVRALLEIARQVERLEITIRAAAVEASQRADRQEARHVYAQSERRAAQAKATLGHGISYHGTSADCHALDAHGRCPGHEA